LKPEIENPLGKEEEKEENGELQAVEAVPVARKEGENGGDAEHECRTDERNRQTGHKGEEPNADEGE
jgi:hypothetical protein